LSAADDARPKDRRRAWLMALAVHALFVGLLVFGISWHHHVSAPVMAEIWTDHPTSQSHSAAPAATAPEHKPTHAKPAPSKPVPPKPVSQPKALPVPKADISLKKKEKLKKEAEEKARAEKDQQDLRQIEEALNRQQEEESKQAAEDQRRRQAAAVAAAAASAQAAAASAAAKAAEGSMIERYKNAIVNKIKGNTDVPDSVPNGTSMDVVITVLPTGEVLEPVKITRSSGNKLYDEAVVRGIIRSQPLPLPDDPRLKREFRTLQLLLKHEK
jgi:colicin import membrane protein